jgi:hypothetical protein
MQQRAGRRWLIDIVSLLLAAFPLLGQTVGVRHQRAVDSDFTLIGDTVTWERETPLGGRTTRRFVVTQDTIRLLDIGATKGLNAPVTPAVARQVRDIANALRAGTSVDSVLAKSARTFAESPELTARMHEPGAGPVRMVFGETEIVLIGDTLRLSGPRTPGGIQRDTMVVLFSANAVEMLKPVPRRTLPHDLGQALRIMRQTTFDSDSGRKVLNKLLGRW